MNPENILAGTASLFLALGDKTRLRLLNLMRDREVCVSSFTGILGQSQPLISRHLAYLRNSGLVDARRDGKWVHYSISAQLDENSRRLLLELFKWMENQEGLRVDREKYLAESGETPEGQGRTTLQPRVRKMRDLSLRRDAVAEVEAVVDAEEETFSDYDGSAHHNELEDFLL